MKNSRTRYRVARARRLLCHPLIHYLRAREATTLNSFGGRIIVELSGKEREGGEERRRELYRLHSPQIASAHTLASMGMQSTENANRIFSKLPPTR